MPTPAWKRQLRCEAAGTSMQPSLRERACRGPIEPSRGARLDFDPSFGNYVQTFPADMPATRIADHILRTLSEVYGADAAGLEMATSGVADMHCPPRNCPSQNLAGIVNDAPSMRATAVRTCSYVPTSKNSRRRPAQWQLVALYGTTVTAEIQRLRINVTRRVFVVFSAGIGYIQCMPDTPRPRSIVKLNRRKAGRR